MSEIVWPICLVFVDQLTGEAAQEKIWINRVKEKAAEGNYLVGDYSVSYTSAQVATMTDAEVYALDIYGAIKQKLSTTTKGSENWAFLTQCYDIAQWFIYKPPDKYMTGVTGYTEEPFDPAWLPPIEG